MSCSEGLSPFSASAGGGHTHDALIASLCGRVPSADCPIFHERIWGESQRPDGNQKAVLTIVVVAALPALKPTGDKK
jgi:hypothetical protein